jgi:hypothetical protein
MAKGGDKRRVQENSAHVQKLKILIAVANVRRQLSLFIP